jgi:hypothetical protein
MGALLIFSVMATSAGQSFSLGIKIEEARQITQVQGYHEQEIEDLINRRDVIDKELSDINAQINRTVRSLQDRANWRTALATAEKRKVELTNERTDIADKLKELYSQNTILTSDISAIVNIYDFYSKIFGWKPENLQLILHTILSVFIALMAPVGLITYPQKTKQRTIIRHKKRGGPKDSVKKTPEEKWKPWIERWVKYNWIGVKNGSREILSRIEFDKFAEAQGFPFSDAKYRRIYNAGNKKKIIDKTLILCYDEKEATEKILGGVLEEKKEKTIEIVEQKDLFT